MPISVVVAFGVWEPMRSRRFAPAGTPSVLFRVISIFPEVPVVIETPSSMAETVAVAVRRE